MVSIHSSITPVPSLALLPAFQPCGNGNPNVNHPIVGQTTEGTVRRHSLTLNSEGQHACKASFLGAILRNDAFAGRTWPGVDSLELAEMLFFER